MTLHRVTPTDRTDEDRNRMTSFTSDNRKKARGQKFRLLFPQRSGPLSMDISSKASGRKLELPSLRLKNR